MASQSDTVVGAMGRRDLLKGSLAVVAAVAMFGEESLARDRAAAPPNIVLINADDLGYADLACYGSRKISTPNLDRLAREGVRFTDFYSCAPVCTPSRAGLMTGRYAIRSGLPRVLFQNNPTGIPDTELTMAQLLKARGYSTACVGKWHLGHLPQFLPTRHGFDSYYGIPYSNDMGVPKDGYRDVPLMENEETVERPAVQDSLTRRYTERTVKLIKEHKNGPFFIYMAHTFPHVPLYASAAFKGKSKDGLFGDTVEEIDWGAGEIMKALRDQGLERNTIVMFTSDNGPYGHSARPLRGGKSQVYEGGMREPFIARWPGHIRPGSICRQPASQLDLLPTLVRIAGGKPPSDRVIDGRDIRPLLTGSGKLPDYDWYYFRTTAIQALRRGKWKLHVGRGFDKLAQPELFNLDLDISESMNVAGQHPDIAADLSSRIDKFSKGLPADAVVGGSPWNY